ncbi:long-chain-fatty-acid--CoA ligase [Roseococcus pinisoli]|uniref:AMP-binding protein n=1 Tax=Roseococcus pinisoli TaxID=2835040 RepID=A0ABS5QJ11_9PROT|nr:long-chain-fatty-acid--CoA ligase [Roseococcus pinisoli]MBS7813676.1 AMP-binding protein [Roseococcus pinisoli]
MSSPNAYWPAHLPRRLPRLETTLAFNLRVSAARHPSHRAIGFYGHDLDWRTVEEEVEAFAGWLRHQAGLRRGDRVLLFLQNCPQYVIAYYAALRADCVVVPVNPMTRASELRHLLSDSGAAAAVVAQDLAPVLREAAQGALRVAVVAYSDYLPAAPDYDLPDWLREPARAIEDATPWRDALAAGHRAPPPEATPDDLALLPYTSGSTGLPKGCEHPHRTFQHTAAGCALWHGQSAATVTLGLPPMYQVAGLNQCLHLPVLTGGTILPMPRWDPRLALQLIERYGVTHLPIAPTACIDLLTQPDLAERDLGTLRRVTAGGAAMPQEVWRRLREATGLPFIEAYGMTEAAATTHLNPIERPKAQCLGIPFFETEVLVVDPETLEPQRQGEAGEILISGPQLLRRYWGRPEATAEAIVEIDGRRWYRSGDIGHVDEEGYFFMTDRLKRMINAAGFKVWPAEVETRLYEHPHILEACVIGVPDARRGETVKAVVTLRPGSTGQLDAAQLIEWARPRMAAYKIPREVEIVPALPKSAVGKILWRELQERERAKALAESAA